MNAQDEKLKLIELYDDFPKHEWSGKNFPVYHIGMKLKGMPTEEEKLKFKGKCLEIHDQMGPKNHICVPVLMTLVLNHGYLLTYMFQSEESLEELNKKYGNNIYVEGEMPKRGWNDY